MKTLIPILLWACFSPATFAQSEYVRQLTEKQATRLSSWTEDDKQNIWELSGQTEGDIVLLPGQRNGILDPFYRWPNNEIPYELASSFSEEQAAWIKKSLQEYEQKTCVKTRERNANDTDYVYVSSGNSGCWSFAGYLRGKQLMNLQSATPGSGCLNSGTIVHEFLHAFGFYHQQSATERDDYVEIIWENIQTDTEQNFEKYGDDIITSFGQPYDYGSVMHYSAYAFSKNGEKTIVTKDPDAVIGQRDGLSDIDIIKLKTMYECV